MYKHINTYVFITNKKTEIKNIGRTKLKAAQVKKTNHEKKIVKRKQKKYLKFKSMILQ